MMPLLFAARGSPSLCSSHVLFSLRQHGTFRFIVVDWWVAQRMAQPTSQQQEEIECQGCCKVTYSGGVWGGFASPKFSFWWL
jgi:hypothetical protein